MRSLISHEKNPFLVIVETPTIICKEATEKHNEVTVAKVKYLMPFVGFVKTPKLLNKTMFDAIMQAGQNYPNINFGWNNNLEGFTFVVTTITKRSDADVHDQKFANKMVLAKANAKACTIANTIINGNSKIKGVKTVFEEAVKKLTEIDTLNTKILTKETALIQNL